MSRTIAFLVFPDFQILDAAGPIAAFEIAGRYRRGAYAIAVAGRSPQAGPVAQLRRRRHDRRGLRPHPADRHPGRRRRQWQSGGRPRPARARVRAPCGQPRAADDQRLFRRLCAGRGRPARRSARHHPLEPRSRLRAALSQGAAGAGPHLCPRRPDLDLGGHHRRHRPGAGHDRRGPGRDGRPADRPAAGGLSPPAGRPVAVLRAAGDGPAGRPFRRLDGLGAGAIA